MTDDTPCKKSILAQFPILARSVLKWSSEQFESKSACPTKRIPNERCTKPKPAQAAEDEADIGPPCVTQKWIPPSQFCPKTVSCCYIKMQDPYAPCCCEPVKPQPPPCPPKCRRRQQREPVCSCDLCKSRQADGHKCCGDRQSTANDFGR